MTINGSGSLDVSGNYRHGVFSKDDLVVYGGSINVSAVEDGLNGKDSVKIGAGDISIDGCRWREIEQIDQSRKGLRVCERRVAFD